MLARLSPGITKTVFVISAVDHKWKICYSCQPTTTKTTKANKSSQKSPKLITMHICTYNIRTFREEEKGKESTEEISQIKLDIIGLSETK